MVGAYIAATIVALVQYLRLRDRRVLPLAALFAFEAQALSREWFDIWKYVFQGAACGAGLLTLLLLTLRHAPAPKTAANRSEEAPSHGAPDTPAAEQPADRREPSD